MTTPTPRKGNRAAHFGGATGITSSARNPVDKLPVYQRNYVRARVAGSPVRTAALAAGVSARQGNKYENSKDIQEAYRYLVRKAVPADELVTLLRGGCHATTPVYDSQGRYKGKRADWRTRKGYIEIAAEHGGYFETRGNSGVAPGIVIQVAHVGGTAPPAVPQLEEGGTAPAVPQQVHNRG